MTEDALRSLHTGWPLGIVISLRVDAERPSEEALETRLGPNGALHLAARFLRKICRLRSGQGRDDGGARHLTCLCRNKENLCSNSNPL